MTKVSQTFGKIGAFRGMRGFFDVPLPYQVEIQS